MDKRSIRVKGGGYHDILLHQHGETVQLMQHGRGGKIAVVTPLHNIPLLIAALQEIARG